MFLAKWCSVEVRCQLLFAVIVTTALSAVECSCCVDVGEVCGELPVLGPVEETAEFVEVRWQHWTGDLEEEPLDHLSLTQLLHTALPHLYIA